MDGWGAVQCAHQRILLEHEEELQKEILRLNESMLRTANHTVCHATVGVAPANGNEFHAYAILHHVDSAWFELNIQEVIHRR